MRGEREGGLAWFGGFYYIIVLGWLQVAVRKPSQTQAASAQLTYWVKRLGHRDLWLATILPLMDMVDTEIESLLGNMLLKSSELERYSVKSSGRFL